MSLWDKFRDLTSCLPGNGRSLRFWKDKWRDVSPHLEFPHLFSFSKDEDISLEQMLQLHETNLFDHFHLPLSMPAFHQSELISDLLETHDSQLANDKWTLSNNSKLSVKKVYSALDPVTIAPAPFFVDLEIMCAT